jgi:hypothetical protein
MQKRNTVKCCENEGGNALEREVDGQTDWELPGWGVLHRLMCCRFGSQLVVLFWEVVGTLGRGPSWRKWVTRGGPLKSILGPRILLSLCFLSTMRREVSATRSCHHDVLPPNGLRINRAKNHGPKCLKP